MAIIAAIAKIAKIAKIVINMAATITAKIANIKRQLCHRENSTATTSSGVRPRRSSNGLKEYRA